VISPPSPKYRIRQTPEKVTRKLSEIRTNGFPASTEISRSLERQNDKPVTARRPAGRQIDSSAGHSENALTSKTESREPDSNVRIDKLLQWEKHACEMVSIDEGIRIDCSDEQSKNADSPRIEMLQLGWNVRIDRFLQ
jgi:hypothetical protein